MGALLGSEQIQQYENSLNTHFKSFKEYIHHANCVGIKAWLRSYVPHTPEHQDSFLRVLEINHTALLFNADGVSAQQVKQSRLAILQHLDGMEQLAFNTLIFKIDSAFDTDYLKNMKVPHGKEAQYLFFNDRFWRWYASFQLHYEKFSVIDDIETFFKRDFLQTKHQDFYLFFPTEKKTSLQSNTTSWHMVLDYVSLSPYYEVLFNYSEAKERYLIEKGITLPNFERVIAIEQGLRQRMQSNPNTRHLVEETLAGIQAYKTIARYNKLERKLAQEDYSKQDSMTVAKPVKI